MHKEVYNKNINGFSLVELSIVLVILGLLTGGILTGQSLIKAAELRAVTTEAQQFTTAVNTFQEKYFALPGDMANAATFWRGFSSCTSSGLVNTGTQTCNGGGNGRFDDVTGTSTPYTPGRSRVNEIFLFWQHLARAGIINGNYSGVSGSNGTTGRDVVFGVNAPASKFNNAGWSVAHGTYGTCGCTSSIRFQRNYGTALEFGATTAGNDTSIPVLTPEQAWNIDTKIDDGHPAYGKLMAMHWNNQCSEPITGAASRTNYDVRYRLTDTSAQCALSFVEPF